MRVNDKYMLEADPSDPAAAKIVTSFATPRTSRLTTPKPIAIVWHYTGGKCGPGYAESLAKSITKMEGRPASWNALIGKDGTIFQSAPFGIGTWHVGMPGVILGKSYPSVNRVTVGVEMENAGQLRKIDGGYYVWPYYKQDADGTLIKSGGPDPRLQIDAKRVVPMSDGTYFDEFPAEQIASATALLGALVGKFAWSREAASYGHVTFKPTSGKVDPGPVFFQRHLPRMLSAIFSS